MMYINVKLEQNHIKFVQNVFIKKIRPPEFYIELWKQNDNNQIDEICKWATSIP